jgi:tRNA A37 methylthiotransferase MiaB
VAACGCSGSRVEDEMCVAACGCSGSRVEDQMCVAACGCSGFCGETEQEHAATVDLLARTRYDNAFLFSYSERAKTYASRHMAGEAAITGQQSSRPAAAVQAAHSRSVGAALDGSVRTVRMDAG